MVDSVFVEKQAFLSSASNIKNAPASTCSEITFLGRSNVGKSTIINAILGKNLAKSSSTPGKTQLINFYTSIWKKGADSIPLCLIDLPGFGYAKVSKAIKAKWQENLLAFLLERSSIKLFIHLLDARHTHLEIDKDVGALLDSIKKADQKILRIYTKADKLNQSQLHALNAELKAMPQTSLIFSTSPKGARLISTSAHLREVILKLCLGRNYGV